MENKYRKTTQVEEGERKEDLNLQTHYPSLPQTETTTYTFGLKE